MADTCYLSGQINNPLFNSAEVSAILVKKNICSESDVNQLNPTELQDYLTANSQVEARFMERALPYLNAENLKRAPARRYNDTMVQRQADKLYSQFVEQVHGKIAQQLRGEQNQQAWLKLIEQNNLLEELEDSMSELNFGDEE